MCWPNFLCLIFGKVKIKLFICVEFLQYNVCMIVLLLMLCRVKESRGWELVFTTPYLERPPQKIAVNAKVIGNGLGDKMLAYSTGTYVSVIIIL